MRKVRMTAMALALLTALTLMGGPALAESADAAQRTVTGRVTAVSAASISMDLGAWSEAAAPDPSSDATVKPNAAAPGATAPDSATSPGTTAPEVTAPDANQPQGDQTTPAQTPAEGDPNTSGGFTASGESLTFSVTESTAFTLGMRSARGSISDISVGSILTAQLSGDAATSVTILRARVFDRGFDRFDNRSGGMQGRDFGQPGDRFGFDRGNNRQDGNGWQGSMPGRGQNGGYSQPGCPNCPFANTPGQGANGNQGTNGNQNQQPGQGNAAPGA